MNLPGPKGTVVGCTEAVCFSVFCFSPFFTLSRLFSPPANHGQTNLGSFPHDEGYTAVFSICSCSKRHSECAAEREHAIVPSPVAPLTAL